MKKALQNTATKIYLAIIIIVIVCNHQIGLAQPIPATTTIGASRSLPENYCGDNGTNTIQDGQGYNCLNNSTLFNDQHLINLGIANLRYPGGTVANYHDWRKGYFLKRLPTGFSMIDNFESLTKNWYGSNTWLIAKPINTLFEMRKTFFKIGGDPLYNLNLLTSDLDYQIAMLYNARELNLPVKSIELGNEFYLSEENYNTKFPTVVDYANEAITWATTIKSDLGFASSPPKIAAVGADSKENDYGRRRLWLDNLLSTFASNSNATNIDAVTLHIYNGGGTNKFTDCTPTPIDFTWDGGNSTGCLCMLRKTMNQPFVALDDLKNNELPKIDNAGKEVWITEYNLFDRNQDFALHGTWAHGLFASAMTLGYLEDENITKINMHTMLGDAVWSNVFYDSDGFDFTGFATPCASCTTNAGEYTAIGNAMYLINNAMKDASDVSPLSFTASSLPDIDPSYTDQTLISHPVLYGFMFEKADSNEAVIINFGDEAYSIDIADVLPTATYLNYSYIQLAGDPFLPVLGNAIPSISGALSGSNAGTNNALNYFYDDNPGTTVELPGFSIVVVRGIKSIDLKLKATADVICNNPDPDLISNCNYKHSVTSAIASGGTPPYSYSISGANATVTVDANYNQIAYVELDAGMPPITSPLVFDVTVTDNASLTATVSITINPSFALSVSPACGGSNSICVGETLTLEANTSMPNQSNYSGSCNFIWTPTNGLSCNNCTTVNVTPQYSDSYSVYVTDGTCFVSNDINQIVVLTGPVINKIVPARPFLCNNVTHNLDVTVDYDIDAGNTYSFVWRDPLSNVVGTAATLTLNSASPTTGVYTVTITDANNCTASATVNVQTFSCCTSSTTGVYNITPEYSKLSTFLTANTLSNSITNKDFYINGELHIDVAVTTANNKTMTFEDCRFTLGEKAKIIVDPKVTLNILGDFDFSTCGTFLWNGIELADSRATLNMTGSSTSNAFIADAQGAVNASRDAKVIINKTTFNNNHYHIKLKDYYNDPDPATDLNIRGNVFTSTSVKTYNDFTLSCIELRNILNAPIGMNGTSNVNEFKNAYGGIKAYDAGMTVYNNKFINLLPGSAASIEAAQPNFYNEKKINIGLTDNFGKLNLFDNNAFGIVIYGEYNVAIGRNNFKTLTGTPQRSIDIAIADNITKPVEIAQCSILDFKQGIYIADAGHEDDANPWIKIHDNTIADAISISGSDGIGINVVNGTQHVSRLAIYDNYIENPRIGISMENVNGAKIYKDVNGSATGNVIEFNLGTGALTNTFTGISLNQCDDVFLHENMVVNDVANSSTDLRGFSFTDCANTNVCSNNISRLGYSIYLAGVCSTSVVRLNEFHYYSSAIYFSGAEFSDQGTGTVTSDNTFLNSGSNYRLDGTLTNLSAILWHYDGNNPDMDVSGGYNNVAANKVTAQSCLTCSHPTCDQLPLRMMEKQSASYSSSDEFKIYPNPSSGQLFVEQKDSQQMVHYNVIDASGRGFVKIESSLPITILDVSQLADGMYFLLFKKDGKTSAKQFIIHH